MKKPTINPTHTQTPANLPAVIRPTIIDRIRAAYDRHPNITPAVITLTVMTYSRIRDIAHNPAEDDTRRQRAAAIMRNHEARARRNGHAAAINAAALDDIDMGRRIATSRIRFLDAQTPAELWRELIRDSRTDRDLTTIANRLGDLEREHTRLNAIIARYDAIAERVTITNAERNHAATRAEQIRAQRDSITTEERNLNAELSRPLSDHAYIATTAAAVYHYYGLKAASRAAGQLIRGLSHPDAMRANRTTIYPADKAPAPMRAAIANTPHDLIDRTARQERTLYHNAERIPYGRDGYLTHERRLTKPTPEQPAAPALYIVHHRQTIPAFVPLDAYDSPDKMDDMPRTNGGINAIMDRFDQAVLYEMCASLTATERDIVLKLMDNTAAAEAARAVGNMPAATKRDRATRERARYAAQWESACRRAGVLTKSAQYNIRYEIRRKLRADLPHAQAAAAVFIEDESRRRAAAESAQRAAKPDTTTTKPAPRNRWEILQGVQFTRDGVQIPHTDTPAAVRWTRRPYAMDVQTVPAPDPDQTTAAAYVDTLNHCKPRTAYAAHDARRAAAVFIAAMPAADAARAYTADNRYLNQSRADYTAAFMAHAATRRKWRAEAAAAAADIATYTRRADKLTAAAESAQQAARAAERAAAAYTTKDTTPAARAARNAAQTATERARDAAKRARAAAADLNDIKRRAAIIADLLAI